MKSLKILFGIALITAIFALVSCGEGGVGGSSTPSDVVKTMVEKIADGNYDDVVAISVTKKGETLNEEEQAKIMAFLPEGKKEIDKKGGLKEVVILAETISEDGNTATVKSQLIYGNGEKGSKSDTKLINVNGKWKIRIN
jgi:hypothetical protein